MTEVLHQGLGARHLVCGPDFAFGQRRGSGADFLAARAEALGMRLTLVPLLADGAGPISATHIRRVLRTATPSAPPPISAALDHPGTVAHGDARGSTIDFPTANIALGVTGARAQRLRGDGPAARRPMARRRGEYRRRPTVNEEPESRLKVNIFDFDADIYDAELSVALHAYVREKRRFPGLDALKRKSPPTPRGGAAELVPGNPAATQPSPTVIAPDPRRLDPVITATRVRR